MPPEHEPIDRFRRFSRFYTALIGLQDRRLPHHPVSLAEGRILYETGARPECTAGELGRLLGMDRGQMSRTLSSLERKGLVLRARHPGDRRARCLRLTPAGQGLLDELERRSKAQAAKLLSALDPTRLARLAQAMADIEAILSACPPE